MSDNILGRVIVGTVLGDAWLEKQKVNARFRFEQSHIRTEFFFFLFEYFAPFCSNSPKLRERLDKRTNKIYKTWHFTTLSLPLFTQYYNLFYIDKKKVVPANIMDLMDPRLITLLILAIIPFNCIINIWEGLLDLFFGFMYAGNLSFSALPIKGFNKDAENTTKFHSKKVYSNADTQKDSIIKENRKLSGVYRWTNKLNGKSYIGSSTNLGKRFTQYYNYTFISNSRHNMIIYKAILDHGYSNFTLEILEYCTPSETVKIEQHYLDLFKPKYNILPTAGSSLGYKHTEETLAKFRARILTPEHKAKLKKHLASISASKEHSERSRKRMLKINELKGNPVEVFDVKTNKTSVYTSIRQAAEAIGCVHGTILLADKTLREKGINRLVKKRYLIKIIKG